MTQASTEKRPEPTLDYEKLLRQVSYSSYSIGNGWSIGMNNSDKWQVFHGGFDASFRLSVAMNRSRKNPRHFKTFEAAWQWAQKLTDKQIQLITVDSYGS